MHYLVTFLATLLFSISHASAKIPTQLERMSKQFESRLTFEVVEPRGLRDAITASKAFARYSMQNDSLCTDFYYESYNSSRPRKNSALEKECVGVSDLPTRPGDGPGKCGADQKYAFSATYCIDMSSIDQWELQFDRGGQTPVRAPVFDKQRLITAKLKCGDWRKDPKSVSACPLAHITKLYQVSWSADKLQISGEFRGAPDNSTADSGEYPLIFLKDSQEARLFYELIQCVAREKGGRITVSQELREPVSFPERPDCELLMR